MKGGLRGKDGVVFWLWVIRLMRLVCGLELKIGNICKIGVCIKFRTHYMFLCFKFVYKNNIICNDNFLNKIKNKGIELLKIKCYILELQGLKNPLK